MKINETEFRDKVFGCWLGKCIGGNIGAPYEGMKQRMKLRYSPAFLEKMLPNDDLDLQILWLDVLHKKGKNITAKDLADAFVRNCDYAPGEYAFFRKNYRKGIMPPLSGSFNNEFFNEGMGAPIRSEIWACIFPEDPETAAKYAAMDASIDHAAGGESADGEVFLAVLESLCFGGGEIENIIRRSLEYLPNSKVRRAVEDVITWSKDCNDMDCILDRIICHYGNSESAMVHQNLSIIVAALLRYRGDITGSVLEAVNCGFDTDCTGATVGAVLGILLGGKKVAEICEVTDATYTLGVRSPRTNFQVSALSEEVADLSLKLSKESADLNDFEVIQEGVPAIGFGETLSVRLRLRLPHEMPGTEICLKISEPVRLSKTNFLLGAGREQILEFTASVAKTTQFLPEALPGEVYASGKPIGSFGLSAKRRWLVYGPYWKNIVTVPPLAPGESYWSYIPGSGDEFMDTLRHFHIASVPDNGINVENLLAENESVDTVPVIADTAEDIVRLNENTGFRGNSSYLFRTRFEVPEERTIGLQIGRNTPIRIWLNGELLAERDDNEMYYPENIHKLSVRLRSGENELAFWLVKNCDDARFSYEFLSGSVCTDHVMFSVVNPIATNLMEAEEKGA